ncbi:MAG: hypothetical protein AAGH17_01415, partial [Pseudomonadota bacterium]
ACLGREVAHVIVSMATALRNKSTLRSALLYKPEDTDFFVRDFQAHDHTYGTGYKVSYSGPIGWLWGKALDELI